MIVIGICQRATFEQHNIHTHHSEYFSRCAFFALMKCSKQIKRFCGTEYHKIGEGMHKCSQTHAHKSDRDRKQEWKKLSTKWRDDWVVCGWANGRDRERDTEIRIKKMIEIKRNAWIVHFLDSFKPRVDIVCTRSVFDVFSLSPFFYSLLHYYCCFSDYVIVRAFVHIMDFNLEFLFAERVTFIGDARFLAAFPLSLIRILRFQLFVVFFLVFILLFSWHSAIWTQLHVVSNNAPLGIIRIENFAIGIASSIVDVFVCASKCVEMLQINILSMLFQFYRFGMCFIWMKRMNQTKSCWTEAF